MSLKAECTGHIGAVERQLEARQPATAAIATSHADEVFVAPGDKVFTRDEADDLFLELMTREKVSFFKRNFAYAAVRLAGGSAWKRA